MTFIILEILGCLNNFGANYPCISWLLKETNVSAVMVLVYAIPFACIRYTLYKSWRVGGWEYVFTG